MNHISGRSTLPVTMELALRGFLVCLCAIYASSISAQPAPRMGISPDRYNVTFDAGGGDTQSLLVQNLSDEPLSLTLSVSNWELNNDNQIVVAPPTESSLDQWIVINPMKVTVPPGAPQTIRWAIMPRLEPQPGEYRAIIFIEEDLPRESKLEGTEVRMQMRYGLPIYAQVGDPVEIASFKGIEVSKTGDLLSLDLSNEGNIHARLRGNYGIWPSAEFPGSDAALEILRSVDPQQQDSLDFVLGALPPSVILPGNNRKLGLPVPIEGTGDFTIQFNATFAQLEITDALSFTKLLEEEQLNSDPDTFRVADISTGDSLLVSTVE